MFNTAFRELEIDAHYVRLAASSAREVMTTAREIGIEGLNITAPFKTDIIGELDDIDTEARKVGSVNTVVRRDGAYVGYNTDIAGVARAVKGGGFDPRGQKGVVIGAGGAARAAAYALIREGCRVTIVNRTFERARDAAEALGCDSLPLDRLPEAIEGARLLVSAVSTETSLVDPGLLPAGMVVLDANYGRPSPFASDERGDIVLVDGREWLLGQALPAFELFVVRDAPEAAMRKALWKKRRDARRNIALIGFMGTGKSVVAQRISALSGMRLVDIDKRIEDTSGTTIAEIFRTQGEAEFRRIEQAEIEELGLDVDQVAACGGGAVMNRSNVRVLRNNCLSVWLWADIGMTLDRVGDTASRPLLGSGAGTETAARALLAKRIPFYARTSDLLVNTAGKTPEEIAGRIWDEFGNSFGD
jgi:shikimate dehydrogenase